MVKNPIGMIKALIGRFFYRNSTIKYLKNEKSVGVTDRTYLPKVLGKLLVPWRLQLHADSKWYKCYHCSTS